MEQNDKQFFEELAASQGKGARFADPRPEETHIELAKSGESVISRPKVAAKKNLAEATGLDDEPEGQLTIDVYQAGDEIVVESAVAGVSPDDIDINVTSDSITIKGARRKENQVSDDDYFYQECYWGRFSRSVILPQEIDPEKVYANFKNGILSVHLPRISRQKSKKVKVKLE